MTILLRALCLIACLAVPAAAQEDRPGPLSNPPPLGQATQTEGVPFAPGGSTLEDILRRQQGLDVDDSARRARIGDPPGAPGTGPLNTLGGASDPDLWRALRFNEADVTSSNRSPTSRVLIQDGGMRWVQLREGPLLTWGGGLLLVTLAVLAAFLALRGRIRIDGTRTGIRVPRFKAVERFGHWLLAGSFVLLGITGLISLMGRKLIIPLVGHEAYAATAQITAYIHDNVSWAFMLALVLVFVMWVAQNIPNRNDVAWVAAGGGILTKRHVHARKFNAGQKMIFWAVIVLGISISLSGLSLLFPFELPMFAKTFGVINATGLPGLFGGPLPVDLAPHEEMQLAQLWHGIVAFLFMAIVLAHIYLGSVGMEGAFDAMGRGDVELQWAREHHDLWVEELRSEGVPADRPARAPGAAPGATPAE